ncbi:conserved hypothetical protein [Thermosulfidibacter takaii ABI70S6]|uniref:DUF454 family protein n=1 Tax=Thermosulfidibacter takaii (strain DSM 17441 / JCM 13301 / NBRC 103674 / ABI70S6) TaxID=1298851 RepID=A0A0S3QT12_THET7|nr:DUF454 family protein [Thermosulfidibacter takaii]BAT71472.1 conserved hypothetical protein [Thermosulfidibacter takaii ABI70S6]
MKRVFDSIWVLVVVFVLVILGILGVLLPILPGIPFFVLALILLSKRFSWAKKLLSVLEEKYEVLKKYGYKYRHNKKSR